MAYLLEKVNVFDKGTITEIGDEAIPAGAASDSTNFLDLGDRIELVRGQFLIGNANATVGVTQMIASAQDISGVSHLYKFVDGKIQHLDPSTNTWNNVLTGITDELMSWDTYRSPAGAFIWFSSPNTGLYRINLSNPETIVDLYDASKNFRGYIRFIDSRLILWGDTTRDTPSGDFVGNQAVIRGSKIDSFDPYNDISSESLGSASGSDNYSGTLAHTLVNVRTLEITHSSETFTDQGDGTLDGSLGGTGTINYTTGAWDITFASAQGSGAITADYTYETPANGGVADFRYTGAGRLAGEGFTIFQGKNADPIVTVVAFDGVIYAFHERSIWFTDIADNDTSIENKIFRNNSGTNSLNGALATGDGIVYVDTALGEKVVIRLMQYNDISSRVIPKALSDNLNLENFSFSGSFVSEFGDFWTVFCKDPDNSYNETMWLYNKKWELWDKVDLLAANAVIHNNGFYVGSSVNLNVYQMFSGFDDDESVIEGSWTSNDWTLNEEERKKCKKFVVEGDMAESQELIVEMSFDGDDFFQIGTIAGTSEYVDADSTTEYGLAMYGDQEYGSGETVTASRYMRKFRLPSDKFYRVRVRFRTESFGYLNVRMYIYDDIRRAGYKLPDKFR